MVATGIVSAAINTGCGRKSPQTPVVTDESLSVLPLTRVRLYESGVGYFEREGRLLPGKTTLPVPSGHLDDALTTLVVLSQDGAHSPSGVTFASRLSPAVARARAGLPANQETPLSYDRLLVALRGERVVLRFQDAAEVKGLAGAQELTARVIDVVAVEPNHPSYDHLLTPPPAVKEGEESLDRPSQVHVLVLTDGGEILRVDASQVRAVKPLNETVLQNLNAAMSAHLSTRSNQRQMLEVTGGAEGQSREIALAYLAEAPVWRTSYRLRVGNSTLGSTSRLQAWALLHNDTDEHWQSVDVELVLGRPTSFMYPVTAPRYERRDLETPASELSSVPQLSTTTPDALWGDFSDYDGEHFSRVGDGGVGGLGLSGFGEGYGGLGGAHASKKVKVRAQARSAPSELIWIGDLSKNAKRVRGAAESSPLFQLPARLDLAPQHSAMMPFLDVTLDATTAAWFSALDANAERAVGLNNTTNHTLPAGPMVVYGDGGFLGEAMLQTLQSGGRQFARIGNEPDLTIDAGATHRETVAEHVDFRDGELRVHRRETAKTQVSFRNQTGRAQNAYLALDMVGNGKVTGADDLDFETTSSTPLGVFAVEAASQKTYSLTIVQALMAGIKTEDVKQQQVRDFIDTATLPERERDVLKRALPLLQDYEVNCVAREGLTQAISDLKAELTRAREDLKELATEETGTVPPSLVQRVFDREDRLVKMNAELRRESAEGEKRKAAFENALSEFERFRDEIIAGRGD